MDFRCYQDPTFPGLLCYKVRGLPESRTALQLVQLTKDHFQPHPPLGFEVWPWTVDCLNALGRAVFYADAASWRFEPGRNWGERRGERLPEKWGPTLGSVLEGALRYAKELQADEGATWSEEEVRDAV